MIQQEYFTRARGGLFTKKAGYDSIAKSADLRPEFIRQYIHPLCNYNVPNALAREGESNEDKYPTQFMVTPIITGELVIGQSTYKKEDFTGLQSTFFVHNYILSEEDKKEYVKSPEKLFGIKHFETSYDAGKGRELPALADIPYERSDRFFTEKHQFFRAIGMTDTLFKQLIYAIMMSVQNNKKVFISLNVPLEEQTYYAKALLYHAYKKIPWKILERIGVTTYLPSCDTKTRAQIIFVDPEGMIYDEKTCQEYIFDFNNEKFINVDMELKQETYFNMLFDHFNNHLLWEEFNDLADAILMGVEDVERTNLQFYNSIAKIIEINFYRRLKKDYRFGSNKARGQILSEVVFYESLPLNRFIKVYLEEVKGYILGLAEKGVEEGSLLQKLEIELFHLTKEHLAFIQLITKNFKHAAMHTQEVYIEYILKETRSNKKLHLALLEAVFYDELTKKKVGHKLIDKAFDQIEYIDAFINKMDELSESETVFIREAYYENKVKECFKEVMTHSAYKEALLKRVQEWCKKEGSILKKELLTMCEVYFLEEIKLEDITTEETLCHIKFSKAYDEYESYCMIEKYKSLRAGADYNRDQKPGDVIKKLQQLIRRYYKEKVDKQDFPLVAYAFLEEQGEKEDQKTYYVDVEKALHYLNYIDVEMMLDFLIWLKTKEQMIQGEVFDACVINFFTQLKSNDEKLPKKMIKNKLESNELTKGLYKQLKLIWQPSIMRFLSDHRLSKIS